MLDTADEERLLDRMRRGEEAAFRSFFEFHVDSVYAVAERVLGRGADVDDVVQESFIAAFKAIDRFRGKARTRTWMYRIAVNCALRSRGQRRWPKPPSGAEAAASDTEDRLIARLELVRACAALGELDARQREALFWHDVRGLTAAEIAKASRAPLSTVLSRLSRGRRALVRLFRRGGVDA